MFYFAWTFGFMAVFVLLCLALVVMGWLHERRNRLKQDEPQSDAASEPPTLGPTRAWWAIGFAVVVAIGAVAYFGWTGWESPFRNGEDQATKAEHIAPQPDAGLVRFEQLKHDQMSQVEADLSSLGIEIADTKAKIVDLESVVEPGFHRVSPEEVGAWLTLPGLYQKLQSLEQERTKLSDEKDYLRHDIWELGRYTDTDGYYQFKTSQLDDLTDQLMELRLDMDAGLPGAEDEYYNLLPTRGYLQRDIGELALLL